jgi:hypothetical protein
VSNLLALAGFCFLGGFFLIHFFFVFVGEGSSSLSLGCGRFLIIKEKIV